MSISDSSAPTPHDNSQQAFEQITPAPLYPYIGEREVMRLIQQQDSLSRLLHGPLPASLDMTRVERVLEVACGLGCWAHEMIKLYPRLHITAIDHNPRVVAQAQALCTATGSNVPVFLVQDIRKLWPETFAGRTFDLIHMRFVVGDILFHEFDHLITSLGKLGKRGSKFVWRECELPLTSSCGCDCLENLILCALQSQGRAFSASFSLSIGIGVWMSYWLRAAGYRIIEERTDYIDISYGKEGYEAFREQAFVCCEIVRPFLVRSGVIAASDLDNVIAQVRQEVADKSFCGVLPVVTVSSRSTVSSLES
ncbi:class I SAM-dependent methyltransferase [Ktedonosporobacter rubrisoli]|uniref:Class I SAM-dependent methyltransferase n=1 Tax=Ktedonosporobacter rubrisoli TaxID=2509675 RepID=A0A4P6K5I6_KTERU|nr:class I SAM-dependent methyltransferase [Ktedonosporobacter rubrisoli]QBD83140.1 class I SAM-dependent methyltransferase [Ktedonosporobacter rubrisoli]